MLCERVDIRENSRKQNKHANDRKSNHMQLLNVPPEGVYFRSRAEKFKEIFIVAVFTFMNLFIRINVCGFGSAWTHCRDAHDAFRSGEIPESHSRTAPNAGRCDAGATDAGCSLPRSSAPWLPAPPECF